MSNKYEGECFILSWRKNGKKRIALVPIDLYFRNSDGSSMISLV